MKASEVMRAMEVTSEVAASFLRISFGPATNEDDIEAFLSEWRQIAERTRQAA